MKCVLEPLHSPVSRELCVQRRATHMTTLNDRRKVLAAPLMVAGWAEILATFLVQVESTVIYFVCLRQRPIKIKRDSARMNCSDDPVPDEVTERNLKLSKEHRLAYFMCLRLTTPSIRLHPNVATTGWPNWFSMILLHVDQIAFETCLHEFDLFELCLMSAWNVGDLPLLIGNEMLFGELKMESIGIALVEIWAVLNPIQFEVWVELEPHKRSRSRWNCFGQDQVNVV